jgi:hypothetical protein
LGHFIISRWVLIFVVEARLQGRRLQGRRAEGRRLQGRRLQGRRLQGRRLQGRRLQGRRQEDFSLLIFVYIPSFICAYLLIATAKIVRTFSIPETLDSRILLPLVPSPDALVPSYRCSQSVKLVGAI